MLLCIELKWVILQKMLQLFARKQFIDYDIDAPLINHLRNTATPFLSFTYRIDSFTC